MESVLVLTNAMVMSYILETNISQLFIRQWTAILIRRGQEQIQQVMALVTSFNLLENSTSVHQNAHVAK